MKSRHTFLLGLPLIALGLAGCGDSDSGSTSTANTPTTSTEVPVADSSLDTTTTTTPAPSTTTSTPTTTASTVAGTSPTWQRVTTAGVSPPPRSGATLAATPDGEVWMFGGHVDREPMADLWHFDGEIWEEVTYEGGPSPRSEHAAAWDSDRSRLVVALGEGRDLEVFDDVWAFDPATGAWEELASGGPSARYGQCAVIDGDGRLVISHGFSSVVRFGDTWAYDFGDESWTDITPTDGPRPSDRCLHACGYDTDNDEMILFGGRNDSTLFLGDTWRLGEDGWREITGEGPSARARSRGTYLGGFLVLGGEGDGGFRDDAWILGADVWALAPADVPTGMAAPAITEIDGVIWLFGGLTDSGATADFWRFG